jgi:hypothetical protein
MSTIIRSALIALVLTSTSAAIAAPAGTWTDETKQHGGYDPNSAQGNRAFWDYQGRHGN